MNKAKKITPPLPVQFNFKTGLLNEDPRVQHSAKTIGNLAGVFLDEEERCRMSPTDVVYDVQAWRPVLGGAEGGLFWGTSTVYPGMVGDEYFMTRGHFHQIRNRAEYYVTVSGSGMLVLMDEQRTGWIQEMRHGTTHYIPGEIAHRVVNTGDIPLTFLACWPSDAGYDYATIAEHGFSIRILRQSGCPTVVYES